MLSNLRGATIILVTAIVLGVSSMPVYAQCSDSCCLYLPIILKPASAPPPTPQGLCPIDMSLPGVYLHAGYSESHHGLDIAGPYGTPHRSPDSCTIDELYIGSNGGHGALLICPDLNASFGIRKIGLGHVDFSYNDDDTLQWYGIPTETFFNADGSPKTNVLGVVPTQNGNSSRGQDLHLYMACTGDCGLVHTHIGAWTWVGGGWSNANDPSPILDCSE